MVDTFTMPVAFSRRSCRMAERMHTSSQTPSDGPLAVSMQSTSTLALTLALSPRRGNRPRPRREKSLNSEPIPALEKVLPLPGGEGRGEGECESQLNSYGLGACDEVCIRSGSSRTKPSPAANVSTMCMLKVSTMSMPRAHLDPLPSSDEGRGKPTAPDGIVLSWLTEIPKRERAFPLPFGRGEDQGVDSAAFGLLNQMALSK